MIEVDKAASTLFEPTGLLSDEALDDHVPAEALLDAADAGWLLAAEFLDETVAGFVMASQRDGGLYVDQLSVAPKHGQKGIGRALMVYLERRARERDVFEITLSTFRDLPWNAPFYKKLGYEQLKRSQLSAFMLDVEAAQAEFMDVSKRTFMRKRLRKPIFRSRNAE